MAFIFTTKNSGGRKASNGFSWMAVYPGNRKSGGGEILHSPQIAISIVESDMEKNRWVIGDRVDVAFDDENHKRVLVKRSPHGTYAISSTIGKAAYGKQIKGIIKFTMPDIPFVPRDSFECKSMNITKEGTIFTFEQTA